METIENISAVQAAQSPLANPVEKRKEKIKNWLKNPYNLIFAAILVFAFIIRLYFFNIAKTQPLWWDESDYMAYAKNLAGFNVDWVATPEHKSLFSFLVAFLFKFGASEAATKFILQIIPSTLTVLLVFLICNEMYKDKRISLIVAFLMATLMEHLFGSMRFHVDITGLFAGFLAIYIFWKGYEKKEKIFGKIDPKYTIPLTVILVMIVYSIRRGYFLFGVFFLIYMLSTRKWKDLLKDKYNWLALAMVVASVFIAEKLIFYSPEVAVGAVSTYYHPELPIDFFTVFSIFPAYFTSFTSWPSVLLYLFWLGFAVLLFNIIISFGHIKKTEKSTNVKSDLFNAIIVIVTLAFFMLVLRVGGGSFGEPRWYFPLLLGTFVAIARGTLFIVDSIKPYNKYLAVALLILLIGIGGYYEVKQADETIKNRATSFNGIKQASLYVKGISLPEDIILTGPRPQVAYYAERTVVNPIILANWTGRNEDSPFEPVLEQIEQNSRIKYLFVSFIEPNHPEWMKKIIYANVNGQTVTSAWEIPFMDTKIDFINNKQDIKQSKTYGNLTFTLLDIKEDVFIYKITRGNSLTG